MIREFAVMITRAMMIVIIMMTIVTRDIGVCSYDNNCDDDSGNGDNGYKR